jgi:hypothetical protein
MISRARACGVVLHDQHDVQRVTECENDQQRQRHTGERCQSR